MVLKARVISQTGHGKNYSFQKVPFIIKTALKLASINGYDDQYRIRNRNGKYLANTNVHDLLNHCMSVGRKLTAENEFIELLAEAGIDPDWILNENVKAKLIPLVGYQPKPAQYRPHPSQVSTSSRTFTELPPPQEIINVSSAVENMDDEDDEETEVDNETHSLDETESIVTSPAKRKIAYATRGSLKRKKRIADDSIEDLLEVDLPKVSAAKRPRWEQLED